MKKKVLIIGSVKLPIPAVKGGAVPNLIEELICQQQIENKVDLTICSLWDEEAEEISKKYSHTNFIWAKVPNTVNVSDNAIRWMLKNVIKKDRILSIGFITQIIWYTQYISKILASNKYDVVIFENSVQMLSSLKFKRNKVIYKDKYYIHMHSVPRKYGGTIQEFNNAKKIICVSEYVSESIIKDPRTQIDHSKTIVMYNCLDTDKFSSKVNIDEIKLAKRTLGISEERKVIVFAGRLCEEKGIEVLLNAVRSIGRDDVTVLLVGSNFYKSGIRSPYEEYLQKLAEDIKDKIVFTGYVDYSQMPIIYGMADVVVLPSMWEEPAGMTIIEAMACGKAVITTVSGGIPEYTGENNCILLDRDEKIVSNIKKAINAVLDDNIYRHNLEVNAANHAKFFNTKYYYNQMIDIIGGSEK